MAEAVGLDWFQGRANYLISLHKDRDDMFDAIDDAINGEWDLPEELEKVDWAMRAPEPSFAITANAAISILADSKPDISIVPTDISRALIVDAHEKGLGWMLANASKRRNQHIVGELGESAVKYGEVCAEVIYLPEQIKGVQAAKGNARRWESMLRRSPFIVNVFHPKSVYPRYSAAGLEEVLMVREDDPHAIVDLWGTAAEGLKERMRTETANGVRSPQMVLYYVYMSYDYHVVWVEWGIGTEGTLRGGGDVIEIQRKKWPWPFLPWACRMSGSNLDMASDRQRSPLLRTMYDFDMYDLMSRVRSLRYSDMIRTAGSPRKVWQSTGETEAPTIVKEAGEEYERVGEDEKIVQHADRQPDPSMATLHAELKGEHQKATLSDLLLGGEVPGGAAYATVNLVTQSAMARLKPVREVVQGGIADIAEIMLLWIHYSQDEVTGYTKSASGEYQEQLIHWKDIDPANLYITCDIAPDLPSDRQARAITARALIESGLYSVEAAMNDVGIKDATQMMDDVALDRMFNNMLAIDLKNEQFMSDIEVRERMKQELIPQLMQDPQFLQMVMQQLQGAQGGQGGPGGRPVGSGPPPTGSPTGEFGGANPDIRPETLIPSEAAPQPGGGGGIPAEFNPNATRETQTGRGPRGEPTRFG